MVSPDPVRSNPLRPGAPPVSPPSPAGPLLSLALIILAAASAAILGALGFEHIGGYQPCHLCLMQRTPYYVGIPFAAIAVVAILLRAPRSVLAALFAIVASLMVYNAGLAVYHSGVEWGLWEGPAGCSPSVGGESAADMLQELQTLHGPSCTDAPWRMLGLSFAGWNALISAGLALLAARAAWMAWRRVEPDVYGSSSASQ